MESTSTLRQRILKEGSNIENVNIINIIIIIIIMK